MNASELRPEYVRVSNTRHLKPEAGFRTHGGEYIYTCVWAEHVYGHSGIVLFEDKEGRNTGIARCLYKGSGEHDWYVEAVPSDKEPSDGKFFPFEGPYPFEVLLTMMIMDGYTRVY